jgi:general nucleoside transport system ATP-binding protein
LSEFLIEAKNLTKKFPGVLANDNVSLTLEKGEIVALLGENGAGKSTLVKMIYGLYGSDGGELFIKGEKVDFRSPADAIAKGIGMVHQHFQLVPVMTVAENIVLGAEKTKGIKFDLDAAEKEVTELSEKYGLAVDPKARIEDLPVGMQQRVEILKMLYRKADILIMDEPTAVLTPQETDELLKVMESFAQKGVGVIFITHKLREVLAVADRVVVLRNGKVVGTARPKDTNQEGLATMMVGRSVVLDVKKDSSHPKDVVLQIKNLNVQDDRKLPAVRDFSLEVRAGEIVGIAGVEGNGQRELVQAITGLRKIDSGSIKIGDVDSTKLSPHKIHELGVAHVPEDREKDGLVAGYSIADNSVLNRFDEKEFSKSGIRQTGAIRALATKLVEKFDVRTPSIDTAAGSLSGGNKQKLVIARELIWGPKLLIAAQPTRGVDVGSIEFIHNQIVAARDSGSAVLLVSAELDEVLGLADRVAVIYAGRIVEILDEKDAERNKVGRLMAGGDVH